MFFILFWFCINSYELEFLKTNVVVVEDRKSDLFLLRVNLLRWVCQSTCMVTSTRGEVYLCLFFGCEQSVLKSEVSLGLVSAVYA